MMLRRKSHYSRFEHYPAPSNRLPTRRTTYRCDMKLRVRRGDRVRTYDPVPQTSTYFRTQGPVGKSGFDENWLDKNDAFAAVPTRVVSRSQMSHRKRGFELATAAKLLALQQLLSPGVRQHVQ